MPPLTDQQLIAQFHTAHSNAYQGHSDQQVLHAYANARPGMPWGEDAARSFVTGAQRGITSLVGLPDTLRQAAGNSEVWLANQGRGAFGQAPLSPHEEQTIRAATQGALSLGGITGGVSPITSPSTAHADAAVQSVAGPYHHPQTWEGRSAETAGSMLPASLMPGGMATRALRIAVPTATSSAAGELTHGSPIEPWARAGGAIIGGAVQGGGESALATPQRVLGRAIPGGLTDDQVQAATALRQSMATRGIDITIPEAVQQVTGGATGLGRVQRLVENTNRTAPQMALYFAQRPDQVRRAVMNFADQVAPDMGVEPGMIGMDAQRAAQGAQMSANSARSQAAGPYYQAADADNVDPMGMGDILARLHAQVAGDKTGLLTPKLSALADSLTDANGEPITDIGNLSTARNFWKDQIDLPPTNANSLSKYHGGIIGSHLDDLDALLKTNPNRVLGDQAYAQASRDVVDPLNAGPVGAIARTGDLSAQTGALYPPNPPLGQPLDTANAVGALNGQDSDIAAALTRQHLANGLNLSTRDLVGGPNQYGGALFAKNIAGNPEQASTLTAGLDTIDPSQSLSKNLTDLLDGLRATGQRQRPGSMTAYNAEDLNALKLPPAAMRVFGGVGDPLEWTKNLANWSGGQLYGHNLDRLAGMIVDPDTKAILAQALAASPNSPVIPGTLPAVTQQGSQP